MSAECNFGELKDRMIKDRIIAGINDKRLKDRLLRESDLNLKKTIQLCKVAEIAEEHVKKLDNTQEISWMQGKLKKSSSGGKGKKTSDNKEQRT